MRSLFRSKLPLSLPAAGRLGAAAVFVPLLVSVVLARTTIARSIERLGELHPVPLALSAVALLVGLGASACAWRCALGAAGAEVGLRAAWGCYGIGSIANAVLPARLGEAVRIGAYASCLDRPDRKRLSGIACATVAIARAAVWSLTCAAAAAAGLLPIWMLAAPVVLGALLGGVYAAARGRFEISAALAAPALLGWAAVAALARVAAAVGVLAALDVGNSVHAAIVGLTVLAAANLVPLGPGGAAAGAGMALALANTGVPGESAVAATVAFHAIETLTAAVFGATGCLALRSARRSVTAGEAAGADARLPRGRPQPRHYGSRPALPGYRARYRLVRARLRLIYLATGSNL